MGHLGNIVMPKKSRPQRYSLRAVHLYGITLQIHKNKVKSFPLPRLPIPL